MKTLSILLLAVLGLTGCVAVPVYDTPVVYRAPPVVVQPYAYGGFYSGRGYYGGSYRRF